MSETGMGIRRKKTGSNRGFGLVFAAVFALFGIWPILRGEPPRLWLLAVAAIFLGLALAAPRLLGPVNALWLRFGARLQKVTTPVVMALLYFVVVCPIALIARPAGRDALRLRPMRESTTYWISRTPPGPDPASMTKQF